MPALMRLSVVPLRTSLGISRAGRGLMCETRASSANWCPAMPRFCPTPILDPGLQEDVRQVAYANGVQRRSWEQDTGLGQKSGCGEAHTRWTKGITRGKSMGGLWVWGLIVRACIFTIPPLRSKSVFIPSYIILVLEQCQPVTEASEDRGAPQLLPQPGDRRLRLFTLSDVTSAAPASTHHFLQPHAAAARLL
ncbi:hypothetical protein GQ53DRAFT_231611 [Thozetella sp. PMI_491]|nr:hypothetical protein GQ53DRAFT_231611 [Thozetella sp. PMI_491]